MAVSVVVEDGTGLSNANSYISRANANLYFDRSVYSVEWDAARNSVKDKALMQATRWIDDFFEFIGKKVNDSQALEFPRYDIIDRSGYLIQSTTIPTELTEATSELAQFIIRSDRTADPDELGFSKIKVGSLELVPNPGDRINESPIPKLVEMMLLPFGTLRGGSMAKVTR